MIRLHYIVCLVVNLDIEEDDEVFGEAVSHGALVNINGIFEEFDSHGIDEKMLCSR